MQQLNKRIRLTALVFLLSLASACGQKGDLYLPENTNKYVSIG
jgi:predicted small lipoprotein YifL